MPRKFLGMLPKWFWHKKGLNHIDLTRCRLAEPARVFRSGPVSREDHDHG
jgi:hypothetical protein